VTEKAPSPWNQFPAFRQQVFQQRDIKETKAVKAANLGVEVQALADHFQREVEDLERFDGLLGHSLSELEEMRTSWLEAGQQSIALWLDEHIRNELVKAQSDLRALVGPSYAMGLLFSLFQRDGEGTAEMPDLTRFKPPDAVSLRFRRRLEWIQDRLTTRILRENLPQAFRERSAEILDVEGGFDDLGESLFDEVAMELDQSRTRPLWRFRLLQWVVYLPLLLFLFLVLGGEGPWGQVFKAPGAGSVFDLILSLVHTLFSSKGLAALASFGLVNLFFGLYFYRRYRKVLRRHADRRLALLGRRLEKVWEESLDRILQGLEQFRSELRERKSSLNELLRSSAFSGEIRSRSR